jgi:hypothetical protein
LVDERVDWLIIPQFFKKVIHGETQVKTPCYSLFQ